MSFHRHQQKEIIILKFKKEIACKWYNLVGVTIHEQYLVFLFLERASYKYEELHINLENDWDKKIDNYPATVNEAYTLLETYQVSNKFILSIVQKSKQNDRSVNINSDLKINLGLSFSQDGKTEQQHIKDNKEEMRSCFKCKEQGHTSPHCNYTTKKNGEPLNTMKQANTLCTKTFQSR